MRFTKMHGAGNDYVYVDCFAERVADAPALSRLVSDRHKGIGSDGLILLAPPSRRDADVRMVMYNADGSRAQMCGNGIRCLARLARDRGRVALDTVRVETDSGVRTVELVRGGARVDMGVPSFDPRALPARFDLPRVVEHPVRVLDRELRITCVSMGNPHVVVYVEGRGEEWDVERYGRAIETDARFPERTNVEFVEVVDRGTVRQRTWERGSGETLACGTGACAVCAAGVATGRTDHRITNHLRGGDLVLEWDGRGSLFMTGEAVTVFEGEWRGDGM